ncbi:MAG: hypothetical protein HYX65_02805 [Gemmatimonadetes bacterium]|nr:hypothetical protein [Gemmatimonadota bacterium]
MVDRSEVILALAGMMSGTTVIVAGMYTWLRARRQPESLPRETTVQILAQLDSLQQSVDTMSLEVERIAEGQRFTTRLLSERGAAQAEPSLRSG